MNANGAVACLRVAVLAVCAGEASRTIRFENELFSVLHTGLGWSEELALGIVHGGAWALLAAGLLLTFVRAPALLVLVSVWIAGIAAARWWSGGVFAELALAAHAVRWLAPLSLALLLGARMGAAQLVARVAVAATFAAHGYEALAGHGEFVDLLLTAGRSVGIDLGQALAESLLVSIGALDVLVAIAVLVGRWRAVVAWMAFWGLATASVRLLEYGAPAYDKILVRAPNGLVPLALLLLWSRRGGEA